MSDTPRIFLRCYTSPAASFSCEVYEMASRFRIWDSSFPIASAAHAELFTAHLNL
jgi:hypothetical protein